MHTDISARADGVNRNLCPVGQLLGERRRDLLCGAGGNVIFLAVVRLGDVVVKRRQRARDELERREQHVHAEGHVWREYHAELIVHGKIRHPEQIRFRKTGGAEHHVCPALLAGAEYCARVDGVGEVDQYVGARFRERLLHLRDLADANADIVSVTICSHVPSGFLAARAAKCSGQLGSLTVEHSAEHLASRTPDAADGYLYHVNISFPLVGWGIDVRGWNLHAKKHAPAKKPQAQKETIRFSIGNQTWKNTCFLRLRD